jgi:hypothetical protein
MLAAPKFTAMLRNQPVVLQLVLEMKGYLFCAARQRVLITSQMMIMLPGSFEFILS